MGTKQCGECKDFLYEGVDGIGICSKSGNERFVGNECEEITSNKCGNCHLLILGLKGSFYCSKGKYTVKKPSDSSCEDFLERI